MSEQSSEAGAWQEERKRGHSKVPQDHTSEQIAWASAYLTHVGPFC